MQLSSESQQENVLNFARSSLSKNYGYISNLLFRLDCLVSNLIEGKNLAVFDLVKTIVVAEFINNELDYFINQYDPNISANQKTLNWMTSEDFRKQWRQTKIYRDKIYSRLIKLEIKTGEKKLEEDFRDYTSYILRFSRKKRI